MALDRQAILLSYLQQLMVNFDALTSEKATLQAAPVRIPQINTALIELSDEANTVLNRYNSLAGTTLTLQEVRRMFTGGI